MDREDIREYIEGAVGFALLFGIAFLLFAIGG